MKQQITLDQYAELPEKHQRYFLEWMEKRGYSHFATIGQLVEMLHQELSKRIFITNDKRDNSWHVQTNINDYYSKELCDGLWEAVKDVLRNLDEKRS